MKNTFALVLAATLALGAPALAFAQSETNPMSCDTLGTATNIEAMGRLDAAAVAAATTVTLVPVAECDDAITSALATIGSTSMRDELGKNTAVIAAVQGRGATLADVIGATVDGDVLTVYVTLPS